MKGWFLHIVATDANFQKFPVQILIQTSSFI
jgi:hypothetical protein